MGVTVPTGLIYSTVLWPALGGPAEHAHQLARHLAELGDNITLLTPLNDLHPGDDDFDRACGYNVVRYPTTIGTGRWWRNPLERRRMVTATLRTARRIKADYLAYAGWVPSVLYGASAALAARRLGIPTFFIVHSDHPHTLARSRAQLLASRAALGSATGVICVCRRAVPHVAHYNVDAERVHVVYNGVDLAQVDAYLDRRQPERFPHLDVAMPLGAPTILTLSNLHIVKRIDKVIRAMPRVVAEVPGARCAIAGTGVEESNLRQLIADSPVAGSITMLGPVTGDQKLECYARCAVFAMPSDDETFPLVFPEAAAFGKPIVSTTVGGIPEAVEHGESGLLVNPGDEQGLADALIRLLKNPEEARRMGANGRRRVETTFNWRAAAEKFRAIVQHAIEERT